MKTLTIIFASAVLLTSCVQKESYSCESELTTTGESQCVCQLTTKPHGGRKCVKSKNGLIIMYPKINY